jgi:hypothetical protein
MRIWIIKEIIAWLWRHHKYLVMETIAPGKHLHKDPKRKQKASPIVTAQELQEMQGLGNVGGREEE